MRTFFHDCVHELRQWRRNPGLTLIAVLTLGLGSGASALMLAVIDSVLVRPLAFPAAAQLMFLETVNPDGPSGAASLLNFRDWRARSRSFSGMAAYVEGSQSIRLPNGEPLHVTVMEASANVFDVLGIKPLRGRTFYADEDADGKPCVTVLKESFWREHFEREQSDLSQNLTVNGERCSVVGVMPDGFSLPPHDPALWIPLHPLPQVMNRAAQFLQIIGRLAPSATVQTAQNEMKVIGKGLADTYPEDKDTSISVKSYQELVTGNVRLALLALLGAVALLFLISCANVANLQLAAALSRKREFAVRTALGAQRGRLIRQLMTEKAVLALVGTGLGLLMAYAGLSVLKKLAVNSIPRVNEIQLHWEVWALMVVSAAIVTVAFGLAPVVQAMHREIEPELREGATAVRGGRGRRAFRDALVVGQLGLAIMLVVGSGLLLRTLYSLIHQDFGFATQGILTLQTAIPTNVAKGRDLAATLYEPEMEGIKALPGVKSVGFVTYLPLTEEAGNFNVGFGIVGQPVAGQENGPTASLNAVSEDYFKVLQIPLLRGRLFDASDTMTHPHVVVVNNVFAHKYFREEDPIGKLISIGDLGLDGHPLSIIGVVRSTRQQSLARMPDPEIFVSFRQIPPDTLWANFLLKQTMSYIVQTDFGSSDTARSITAVIHRVDPGQTVFHIQSMQDVLLASVNSRRLGLILLGVFAGLALVVASAGLYGVLSYNVGQRTNEIAVRMALGARRHDMVWMIVRQALMLCLIGLFAGATGAVWCGYMLASMLPGVPPWDPLALLGTSALLICVAILAAWFPAMRASLVEPAQALRAE